jgi:hypothetical protein
MVVAISKKNGRLVQVVQKHVSLPYGNATPALLDCVLTLGLLHTFTAAVALYTNFAIRLQSCQLLVVSQLANLHGNGTTKMVFIYRERCYSQNPKRSTKLEAWHNMHPSDVLRPQTRSYLHNWQV